MAEGSILFVRHGESTWNAEARWQGWGDPPLSARGRAQAEALAARLAGTAPGTLLSSDLTRAAETARILGVALGLAPRFDPRLRERDLGVWSGLTEAEIAARHGDELARFRARDPEVRPGGGESRAAFHARVAPALAELGRARGRVLVVTHLGVLRLLAPETRPGNAEVLAFPASVLASLGG